MLTDYVTKRPTPDAIEALRLAVGMRAAQTAYFRDRTRANLIASKEAERIFDRAAKKALDESESSKEGKP